MLAVRWPIDFHGPTFSRLSFNHAQHYILHCASLKSPKTFVFSVQSFGSHCGVHMVKIAAQVSSNGFVPHAFPQGTSDVQYVPDPKARSD
jgi:hypothetical protein